MKTCPKCGAQSSDGAKFCTTCGYNYGEAPMGGAQPQPQPQPQYQQAPQFSMYKPVNPCDKPLGIVAVLCGFFGVLVAYFGGDVNGQRSDYLRFYANEGLVIALFSLLSIIPFVGWIWGIFMIVCDIIAIVYACKGITKPVLFFGTLRIIK